jgi:hypothetical protein
MDFSTLDENDLQQLLQQGVSIEEIAIITTEQGQQLPPIIEQLLMAQQGNQTAAREPTISTKQFPSKMSIQEYGQYSQARKMEKERKKSQIGEHKPNVFGYEFSDLANKGLLDEMKRTQGSFLVGVNLINLFNDFGKMIATDDENKLKNIQLKPEEMKARYGNSTGMDYEKALDVNMGYRGTDVQQMPELELDDYSSFNEILSQAGKFTDSPYRIYSKITPNGLLQMTRMLFKYRKNNAQWLRVATVLQLIYQYIGKGQTREQFFNSTDEIPIKALMELEEFYNTDQMFMTEQDLIKFKQNLQYYKYSSEENMEKIKKDLERKMSIPPV